MPSSHFLPCQSSVPEHHRKSCTLLMITGERSECTLDSIEYDLCMCGQEGVRENATIMYNTALGVIFGVKKYANELLKVVERKGIQVNYKTNLVEVDAVNRQAIFEVLEQDRQETFTVS